MPISIAEFEKTPPGKAGVVEEKLSTAAYTLDELAAELQTTPDSIKAYIYMLRKAGKKIRKKKIRKTNYYAIIIPPEPTRGHWRKRSPITIEEINAEIAKGETKQRIADKYGVSITTIWKRIYEAEKQAKEAVKNG